MDLTSDAAERFTAAHPFDRPFLEPRSNVPVRVLNAVRSSSLTEVRLSVYLCPFGETPVEALPLPVDTFEGLPIDYVRSWTEPLAPEDLAFATFVRACEAQSVGIIEDGDGFLVKVTLVLRSDTGGLDQSAYGCPSGETAILVSCLRYEGPPVALPTTFLRRCGALNVYYLERDDHATAQASAAGS